jgi:hypothetical protein
MNDYPNRAAQLRRKANSWARARTLAFVIVVGKVHEVLDAAD